MESQSNVDETVGTRFHLKSNFCPPKNRNHLIDTCCRLTELELENYMKQKTFSPRNLTNDQEKALKELKNKSVLLPNQSGPYPDRIHLLKGLIRFGSEQDSFWIPNGSVLKVDHPPTPSSNRCHTL